MPFAVNGTAATPDAFVATVMLVVLFVYGMARSLQFTTLATLAYADVDDTHKGPASTLWSVAQQMTVGMGIAFGALCLRISAALGAAPASADKRLAGWQTELRKE